MNKSEWKSQLKLESGQLRRVIGKVLNVPVSTAQGLEIIAKLRNFPTWDAACACPPAPQVNAAVDHIEVVRPGGQVVKLPLLQSGLFIVTGGAGSGKSTLLGAISSALARPHEVVAVSAGNEFSADVSAIPVVTSQEEWRDRLRAALRTTPKVVVFDELREGADLSIALDLAASGFVVLAGFHFSAGPRSLPDRLSELQSEEATSELHRQAIRRLAKAGRLVAVECSRLSGPPSDASFEIEVLASV
ncbi:ATPase, T2SS/T4P/T4SS family [Herbaspirillum huttiense]|uniref:ATPase, T2SS/T4P/T4SS family n=1 Tax=Herbaspirillum huttiense TaxID=863372 RepID=UPI0039AFE3A9